MKLRRDFIWISNERLSLLRQKTAILEGGRGWNQTKLETDFLLLLVVPILGTVLICIISFSQNRPRRRGTLVV